MSISLDNKTANTAEGPKQHPSKTPGLLSDKKLLRNALCTDWPNYFLGNKNTLVVNQEK